MPQPSYGCDSLSIARRPKGMDGMTPRCNCCCMSMTQTTAQPADAGAICVAALRPYVDRDWKATNARDLDWSVWDTLVHLNDCVYFYAAQILLADPHEYICTALTPDDHSTPARLVDALGVHTRLLAQTVDAADPESRGHHVYGASDPEGFAAMGVLESLVHTYDATHGLDPESTWRPPDDLAVPALARLFPHAPDVAASPSDLFLYMCGRIALGDLPRQTDWRWYGAPGGAPDTQRS